MIQSVLIEIRPGLRTCSVCIVLKDELKDARVRVRNDKAVLRVDDQELTIPFGDLKVEPLTMTCFSVEKRCVNFRVGVESCPKIEQSPRVKRVLPVHVNEVTKLLCKCGCPITDDVVFKRVLPLPSHGLEVADMFCHYDNHMTTSLTPRTNDCLYGIHYISVNRELLKNVKLTSLIKCRRCFACLGLCKKDAVQLWNSCLDLPHENLSPVEEFKRIVRNAVEESFMIFLKIFLECVENNNGLLISVMDKQLIVARSEENLKLRTSNVLKIKYEYHKTNPNLKRLLEKEDIQCIEVPSIVMNEGFEFLMKSTEAIPPMFRTVDGELMAYLEIST
ncbi:UNVERIFIED_CONTAM: hypothetical protein PYX00_006464 [Menopon gallinae]|uniref:Ubiquitin-conjugating enzyme E2C-binding protein n=1 Tax=Menopon gallinae TaxID=328185 RepID=A0AAW2HVL9_9NEOP